jgi:ergothioneine biosynthesis protein EgtB
MYNRRQREKLDHTLAKGRSLDPSRGETVVDDALLHVAIEHRLMHAETLAYLLHNLPLEKKIVHPGVTSDPRPSPRPKSLTIPAGTATLGQSRGPDAEFGWDNEFEQEELRVPSFAIDKYPVTNTEFMKFVRAGGYEEPRFWSPEGWQWIRQQRIEHPHFWVARSSSPATDPDTQWEYRAMFGAIPLPPAWPAYVSYAEANAYAKWARKKLPSEAQWHRAAYGTPERTESRYPWGDTAPDSTRGNFHFERWDATAVDAHPDGASAFGVQDLSGNGWEWTSSPFAPLNGFQPFAFYRGYSADFFDGRHFVMKGGSPRTDACMLRRSFRNWFQPHYPYVYAKFRCVEE